MLCALLLQIAVALDIDDRHIYVTSAETRSLICQLESRHKFPLNFWAQHLNEELAGGLGPDSTVCPWHLSSYLTVCGRLEVLPVSLFPEKE